MTTASTLIAMAFRRFVALIDADRAREHMQHRSGLAAWLATLPWDEKLFKVDSAETLTHPGTSSSGDWMARVTKDGPSLTLTPTVDLRQSKTVIKGTEFWKRLLTALDEERASALGDATAHAAAGTEELALSRWDKRHFLKWTQSPPPGLRDTHKDTRPTPATIARQAYSIFYQ